MSSGADWWLMVLLSGGQVINEQIIDVNLDLVLQKLSLQNLISFTPLLHMHKYK
jgi:hypothetical protein